MARRPASLAVRLTVSIGAVITVVLLTFGWMIERSINEHFVQQDVDELNAVVQALQHTLATLPSNATPEDLKEHFATEISGHYNAQYYISSETGAQIYASPGSDLGRFASISRPVKKISIETVGTWQDHGETFRGAVLHTTSKSFPGEKTFTIAVATSINFHLHYLESFRTYLRIITTIACLIAILATWLAVHQGHAPIRRISREIRQIRSDQLHIRLEPHTVPAELVELSISFNGMIERLEDVFRRLSGFSADIAHELRTPITNLKTQTEVALSQSRSIDQYREVLYSSLEEYERMAKMIGDMLFLAQADNNLLKPELVKIDLEAEMRNLFDYFGAWAEEREVKFKLSDEQICVQGDRLMIRRALSNVLSNAIRYTSAGHTINVTLESSVEMATISVKNPGPVIPAEHLDRIFERFYRTDVSRQRSVEGAGLGLAIAKSIVEAHNGKILASSTPEATEFKISLPAVGS
ncbi:MAG: Cu(+)/Ag(+) sensor histidine kinase [Castellaniella sp.]|uniref:Cu(+)/Ag(+) sensor histidine kinase n=1 Tax=Castellaniella sp. TaxID=1955812 RepID=UPI003A84F157